MNRISDRESNWAHNAARKTHMNDTNTSNFAVGDRVIFNGAQPQMELGRVVATLDGGEVKVYWPDDDMSFWYEADEAKIKLCKVNS